MDDFIEEVVDIDGKVLKKLTAGDPSAPERVEYRYNKKLHRKGGPAVVINRKNNKGYVSVNVPEYSEFWYSHGRKHRLDGPAVIHRFKEKTYYFFCKRDGVEYVENILKGDKLTWWVMTHTLDDIGKYRWMD